MKLVQKPLTPRLLAVMLASLLTGCEIYIPFPGEEPAPPPPPPRRTITRTTEGTTTHAAPRSRQSLIRTLLVDCQNQLIPFVNLIDNPAALQALTELCPDSTAAQRTAVRSALHLMTDDNFLEKTKQQGGIALLAPRIRAQAILREPSLVGKPCLLNVIDEVAHELFANPFGL